MHIVIHLTFEEIVIVIKKKTYFYTLITFVVEMNWSLSKIKKSN